MRTRFLENPILKSSTSHVHVLSKIAFAFKVIMLGPSQLPFVVVAAVNPSLDTVIADST
jgi:hypothetical protein